MNDRQLAWELHSQYEITADVIAEKLELPISVIQGWLKCGPGRPKTVDGLILSAIGDGERCVTQICAASGIRLHNATTYLTRMHKDGLLSRRQVRRSDGRLVYVYKKPSPTKTERRPGL